MRPSIIIEIGSWKGASALHMAGICKQLGLSTEIVCVDTWLGSPEHILVDAYKAWLNTRNGYPQLFYTFMANVIREGADGMITPFPIASESAAIVLNQLHVTVEFIYIDGAHEFDPAYRDAAAFWPLLSESGVMLFDDYGYSDVTKVVCKFAAEVERPVYASYGKAFIPKGPVRPNLTLNL